MGHTVDVCKNAECAVPSHLCTKTYRNRKKIYEPIKIIQFFDLESEKILLG